MDFEDFDGSNENLSAADALAQEVFDRNQALTEAGNEKLDDHNAELSDMTTRPTRFGVGENSQGGKSALQRQAGSTDTFVAAASAQAYAQSVSFSIGGKNVQMSLGDLRQVASDLRNKHGGQDLEKAKAYDGLLLLIKEVADGNKPPQALNEYIEENGIGKEVYEAATNDPAVEVTVTSRTEAEVAVAGDYAEQTAKDLDKNLAKDLYSIG